MLNRVFLFSVVALAAFAIPTTASGQHLWWDLQGQKDATCVYGEIVVLATHPGTYYCGANWHPGEPAGGYCGIQQNGEKERRTIFSIWDTTPKLHPKVTEADPQAIFNRFGGEGTGAHTHMIWDWNVGDTFQFFVQKSPAAEPNTTDARYYIFDGKKKAWLHSATINSPDGDKASVATIGGGLNSFLENFTGQDRAAPRLALYRLWLGRSPDKMTCLTHATGDGTWGTLGDCYFLAAGDADQLKSVFSKVEAKYGKPAFGGHGKEHKAISDKALSPKVLEALKTLPRSDAVKSNRADASAK